MRMGVVSKRPSTRDPCPGLTLASGTKGIGRGRKGTNGALDHTWVVPSCRPGPSSSEGRIMHVGRGLSLSYCAVPEPLHPPSSCLKKEGVCGRTAGVKVELHPGSWLSLSLLLAGTNTCPALGQGLCRVSPTP